MTYTAWLPNFRAYWAETPEEFQDALRQYNNKVRPDLIEIAPAPDGARRYQLAPHVTSRITANFQ